MTWLRTHASVPIRLRTLTEILPREAVDREEVAALRSELPQYKGVTEIIKKQRGNGVWASNILGLGPSKSLAIKDIGTVSQYRRLLELGVAALFLDDLREPPAGLGPYRSRGIPRQPVPSTIG